MIFTGHSELEIKGITEVLENYNHPYEVRISDHVQTQNDKDKKDWLGAYHLNVASTDLLEIEFDEVALLEKISHEDIMNLLGHRVVLKQDEVLTESELSEQINQAKPRDHKGFQKFVFISMKIIAVFYLIQVLGGMAVQLWDYLR